jgi:hypothetical protein
MTYCAFIICALLDDWSCIDLPRALSYIQKCRVRVFPSFFSSASLRTHRPLCFLFFLRPEQTLMRNAPPDVRRRIRTDAAGRVARRANILCARRAVPRPGRPRVCASTASSTCRVGRDGALAAAHASTDLRGPCGAHEQAGGCVLRVLVWCRSSRTPSSLCFVLL